MCQKQETCRLQQYREINHLKPKMLNSNRHIFDFKAVTCHISERADTNSWWKSNHLGNRNHSGINNKMVVYYRWKSRADQIFLDCTWNCWLSSMAWWLLSMWPEMSHFFWFVVYYVYFISKMKGKCLSV